MSLTLTVDGDRWRRHLRAVADETPGLVPVAKGAYPHGDGQVWASASPEHASRLIEQLLDDPAAARAMGARARAHIRQNFSVRAIGQRYVDRLAAIGR